MGRAAGGDWHDWRDCRNATARPHTSECVRRPHLFYRKNFRDTAFRDPTKHNNDAI